MRSITFVLRDDFIEREYKMTTVGIEDQTPGELVEAFRNFLREVGYQEKTVAEYMPDCVECNSCMCDCEDAD